jgi:RNA polymerase sigma-70 factor (ECF subfamily)
VHGALARLPLDQRAVFVLHDLDGHLMKDVAEALGISVNTGYSRLRAARARFTAVVREMTGERSEP